VFGGRSATGNAAADLWSLSVCSFVCGDGIVQACAEDCDDGNVRNGDGCSANCAVEAGFVCSNNYTHYDYRPGYNQTAIANYNSSCCSFCGDGVVECLEQCDANSTACHACRTVVVVSPRSNSSTNASTSVTLSPTASIGASSSPNSSQAVQTSPSSQAMPTPSPRPPVVPTVLLTVKTTLLSDFTPIIQAIEAVLAMHNISQSRVVLISTVAVTDSTAHVVALSFVFGVGESPGQVSAFAGVSETILSLFSGELTALLPSTQVLSATLTELPTASSGSAQLSCAALLVCACVLFVLA